MATPATPVAPAASAPAAAPAAAPAPATPTPATPAAPAVSEGGAAQPPAPAPAPASGEALAPVAKPEPKSSDYPNTAEGLQKFIREHSDWEAENPEAAENAAAERRGVKPEEPAAPTPEAPKPEEAAAAPQPAAEPLPKAFEEAIQKDPALKAALEANPAAQKLVMEAARAAETARPILEIFPTLQDAQFSQEYTNTMLDIKHNSLLGVNDPAAAGASWQGILNQFIETDDQGQPVKDAQGNPVYGSDLESTILRPAMQHKLKSIVGDLKPKFEALKRQVETGVFPSEEAKAAATEQMKNANYDLAAFEYVLEKIASPEGGLPELPELPADATPEQKAFQERLKKDREQLEGERKASGAAKQGEAARTFETKMRLNWQSGVGEVLDTYLSAARERGEYIPDYILQQPWVDPVTKQATKTPALAVQVLLEYDALVDSIPTVKKELQRLQRLGPAGEPQRQQYYGELRTQYLEPIVRRHVESIHNGIRASQEAEAARRGKQAEIVRTEPASAGTTAPATLTEAQIEEKAKAMVEKDPAWASASREDRAAMMMTARTRAKYGY